MNEDAPILPVDDFRSEIEESIKKNIITILTAETGAGKSTRVPLWLHERGMKVNITQPRRIAARSLSYFLSGYTGTKWGEEIGFQTGFEKKKSKKTSLLYLTDGVQMINEIRGKLDYDVLLLDEIHEWNLNQEVLIGIVKKRLVNGFYKKRNKRVVIMSATLQADKLSKYFDNAPVISVPGRGFPVAIHNNSSHFLLSDTVQMVEAGKNVLVFLPGKGEISEFIDLLKRTLDEDEMNAVILPLHSGLTINEQSKVFAHYKNPKVVVATDIAQTSLTIDDIDGVIDDGVKKEIHNIKGIEGLYPVEISRSDCLQRAGRAGRVKDGTYILCSDIPIEEREGFPEPEIRRLNLESVVLRLIKWGISPLEFPYFHSPKRTLIYKAIENLKIFGAVTDEGEITEDGKKMAELPVSTRGARLLIEVQKSTPATMDMGLKLIAILEAKGIVNKDFAGERTYSDLWLSDLINQLYLWNSASKFKKIINFKSFSLAKDIYKELKNRLFINSRKQMNRTEVNYKDLYRSILSSFIDHVYTKTGKSYFKDEEERQLDRKSVLFETLPDMVTGLPFDLMVERENRFTGEREKFTIALITFSSEISFKILDELKPFSYKKEIEVRSEKNIISIYNSIWFGGKCLSQFSTVPDLKDPEIRKSIAPEVLKWWNKNGSKYRLSERSALLEQKYNEVKRLVKYNFKPFKFYWEKYLINKIQNDLNNPDLDIFFNFHTEFSTVTLGEILPPQVISNLKKIKWPEEVEISGDMFKVEYFRGKPFLNFTHSGFENIERDDLLLPTGESCGVVLGKRRFADWDYTVYSFNRWKKEKIFREKWKIERKPAEMELLEDVPFPVEFSGGKGKGKEKFLFYSVPEFEGEKVFLKHFFEKKEAENYFKNISTKWEKFVKEYKSRKIEDIFNKKGWKIK
ncbi:MAG: ATP-dependent RNA helicase [Candidatus Aminicenantes bacterium]|nr:ATP-dependent RNA helicase [Candidatus Aminicenantes bacterium]